MEFMRASSVQFYLQLEAKLPAYVIETEDEHASRIKTWFPGLGLAYLRYDGLTDPSDPQTLEHRNDFGLTFHLRAGARLLRLNDFNLDLFAIGYLPAFGADPDTSLSRFYPLLGQAGVAVGF